MKSKVSFINLLNIYLFIYIDKSQKSSLMISDSESDAIFESQVMPSSMKMNGLSNGSVRDNHNITA